MCPYGALFCSLGDPAADLAALSCSEILVVISFFLFSIGPVTLPSLSVKKMACSEEGYIRSGDAERNPPRVCRFI
jgi:hypothetical protein